MFIILQLGHFKTITIFDKEYYLSLVHLQRALIHFKRFLSMILAFIYESPFWFCDLKYTINKSAFPWLFCPIHSAENNLTFGVLCNNIKCLFINFQSIFFIDNSQINNIFILFMFTAIFIDLIMWKLIYLWLFMIIIDRWGLIDVHLLVKGLLWAWEIIF